MPLIKTKRKDVLRKAEVDQMLEDAKLGEVDYVYNSKDGKRKVEHIKFDPDMVRTLICLLWLFGKRISEVLRLQRQDLFTKHGEFGDLQRGYLYVRFRVLKKKTKTSPAIPVTRVKRIHIKPNIKYVNIIANYVNKLPSPDSYLFPGRVRERTIHVKSKSGKVYTYHQEAEPRMSRKQAYRILKGLNPKCWLHLFRHSLATILAEEEYTAVQLKEWFDWSRLDTALEYISGGPKLTEKISRRSF